MTEDVTEYYTKKNGNAEGGSEEAVQEADKVFNLEDESEIEEALGELETGSMFFKPESGVTYKIKLTSPQMRDVKTNFTDENTGEPIYKKEFSITARGSDESYFEGIYQAGKKVARSIVETIKNSEESWRDITFTLSKSGSGKKSEYSISKDFQ